MEKRRKIKEARICGSSNSRSHLSGLRPDRVLIPLISVWLVSIPAQALDATWGATPGSGNWNDALNWSPPTAVPTGAATFATSTGTAISFSADTTIGSLQFNVGAPAYTFTVAVQSLTITGTGVADNSSNKPTFLISGQPATFGLRFQNASTAGDALITNSSQGHTDFYNTSTADLATITSESGTGVFFHDTSTGGNARFITEAGAAFDISGLTSTAMTAGSIEGAGTYFLGSAALTVGSNNLSTEVTGVIADGGVIVPGGVGGSLIKVGTGTLTLSGANTYTGGTKISGGTLQIGDGVTNGSIIGDVTDNATLAFDPVGSVTFGGAISGTGSVVKLGAGVVVLTAGNSYFGATTISAGTLEAGSITAFSPFSAFTVSGELDLHGFNNTIASLAGTGTVTTGVAGPVTLTAGGDGSSTTFSGTMSDGTGTLAFRKIGPGTMTLSGNNTYSGGTTVVGGVISVGADANLGNIVGGVTLQGGELLTTSNFVTGRTINLMPFGLPNIMAATRGTSAIYQGVISGSGGLQIGDGNSGTVVFRANNTYQGDTTIIANAVLSVDKDAELGNANNGIRLLFGGELLTTAAFSTTRSVNLNPPPPNPGIGVTPLGEGLLNTLAAAKGTTATYLGQVFGTGGLAVGEVSGNNPGVVVLANETNSYTGGTFVRGSAILSVASDAVLGTAGGGLTLQGGELLTTGDAFTTARSVELILADGRNNTLAAGTGTIATYSSVLSGDGALVVGDGTHAGTVLFKGSNTYSGGTVVEMGTLLVDNPQALGTGNVLVNGGVLAADPQPINVLGNYTQNAGGTLQLSIAGRAAGQFDVLNIGGNATLNGTLRLLNLGYQPQNGDKLTLITTGGAVSGRFSQFQNPFALAAGFNTIDLVYARQAVILEFLNSTSPTPVVMTTDFSSFAFTPNQLAAASLLDAVQLDPKAANLISFLNTEPFANFPRDFQKVSPDGLTALYEISYSNANIQKLNLESRLDDIHNGSNGFSSNMKVNGATVNLDDRADADGKSSKAVVEPILQHAPENRWGVWMTGFGDFVDVNGDGNAQGYNFTTGGVSLGLDYRITDQLAIGVMGEYSHTWTSLNPGGHIDVDSGRGGVYATWFSHGFYLNGAIYGGHNNYDSGRAGFEGLANGSTEGAEWSTFIGGGYDFHFGPLTVGPVASLQYTDVGIDSFSEHGSLAPLAIHSGSVESLRSDAGFRLFYQWQVGKILIEPSLKAAWEHEYKYSALPITAGFAGVPGPSATFFGPAEGHDSAVISAGLSAQLTPTITVYVDYDGQLGRDNYDSNAVTGGLRISF